MRSQVYCIFAMSAGVSIAMDFTHWPKDLLHQWQPKYALLFEIAISHWIWSIIEDGICEKSVVSHMTIPPGDEEETFSSFSQGLIFHHIFTIFAFSWSLVTHKLAGLCFFGLMFEIPVLVMNLRDITASFEDELKGFPWTSFWCVGMNGLGFQLYSHCVVVLFAIFRGVPCFLWPLSLVIWRKELSTLPIASHVIYHLLGLVFCFVNIIVFFSYVLRYFMEDLVRMKVMAKSVLFGKVARTGKKKKPVVDSVPSLESMESSIPTTDYPQPLEKVRLVISGQVYDLTTFLDDHPGGREVLLRAARQGQGQGGGQGGQGEDALPPPDATEEFLRAGHSNYALGLMKRYLVQEDGGHLVTVPSPSDRSETDEGRKVDQVEVKKEHGEQVREEDEDEDGEEIFQKPYKIGVDYSTTNSLQMLFGLGLYVLAAFFLSAGICDRQQSQSTLLAPFASSAGCLLFLHTSLRIAFLPLALLLLSALFVPLHKELLRWQCHLVAMWLPLSLAMDVSLLRMDGKAATGLRLLRLSFLMTYALETAGRRFWSMTRSMTFSGRCNALFLRHCLCDCLKRILFSFFDIISLAVLSSTAVEGLFLYRSLAKAANEKSAAVLFLLVLAASLLRIVFFRLADLLPEDSSSHHHSSERVSSTDSIRVGDATLCALSLSSLYTFLALFCWQLQDPSSHLDWTTFMDTFSLSIQSGRVHNASAVLAYAALMLFFVRLPALVRWSGPHFMSQALSLATVLSSWTVASSIGTGRWIAFALFVVALFFISKESMAVLKTHRVSGSDSANKEEGLSSVAVQTHRSSLQHLFASKQLEEQLRGVLAHSLVSFVLWPLIALVNTILPDGLYYYMHPLVLADLGPRCDVGIALQINGAPQHAPKVFQLNVGHLDEGDLLRTTTSTRDMMVEILEDPSSGEKGFVTDIVALFPLEGESGKRGQSKKYAYREVNLSAWTSDKAAHDWYVKSPAHKRVVKSYKGRKNFSSFSAMFASLSASVHRPLRWEVRCRSCKAMNKMATNDESIPCATCGKVVDPIPYV